MNQDLKKTLWAAADKLRSSMDAAEYKHIVLGLIFLKYISDSFAARRAELERRFADENDDYYLGDDDSELLAEELEERDYYKEVNVFWVPEAARWVAAIEAENPSLKNILDKRYARAQLPDGKLGELVDLISTIGFGADTGKARDLLGQVYEYFLGQFASAEGKKGGQFYTPASIVKVLVEVLAPHKGKVYDPCCGSGGMFVQSEKFITAHQDHYKKKGHGVSLNPADLISIYGQESNQTTWRLAKMNLAIRGIDSSNIKWNNEGSFLNDAHKDLKADFIIANPPFNDSDWSGDLLKDDARWKYGIPPSGNANYAWIQHFIYHMSPTAGMAGFVLAKGSLTSKTNGEGETRKAIIEAGLLDCIVNLPAKLFLNTQIPACLWFLSHRKEGRLDKVLFIDARNLGYLINRRTKDFTDEDIDKITETYHHWHNKTNYYEDVPGFCKSVFLDEIREKDYVLTPGRYIGLPEDEDDFDFAERFGKLKGELDEQMQEEARLNALIIENLGKVKLG